MSNCDEPKKMMLVMELVSRARVGVRVRARVQREDLPVQRCLFQNLK